MVHALLLAAVLSAPGRPLEVNLPVDGAVTGGLALGWVLTEFAFKSALAPATCRWCESNGFDDWARGIRATGNGLKVADTTSNIFGFGLAPLATAGTMALMAGLGGSSSTIGYDLLIVAESTFAALALNQVVKFIAGRARPYAAHPSADFSLLSMPNDDNLSFFSGHTTLVFALTAGAATVARLRGYANAYLVWVIGLPFAITTAVLRMVADKHYLTDVLVGAAVGTLFGIGLPLLLHNESPAAPASSLQLSPTPGGFALTGQF